MAAHYDIIPDIHGHSEKLAALLSQLGYERRRARWWHANERRQIVFLGDFIDRGPDSRGVLETVRDLIADGRALAVMGNHELNAFHYHNRDPETGEWLRPHSEKNEEQHEAFLRQCPIGSDGAFEWTGWMAALPLWLDLGPFRVVHACWDRNAIRRLARFAPAGVLPRDKLLLAGRWKTALCEDVETLTKGPERELPEGGSFVDKGEHVRTRARIAWWKEGARTWREAAMSVPDLSAIPDGPLPADVEIYPSDEKPVFFGHYWMTGDPRLEAANALCLDYSAGEGDNPLLAYAWEPGATALQVEAIVGRDPVPPPPPAPPGPDADEIDRMARAMQRAFGEAGPIAIIRDADVSGIGEDEFGVAMGELGAPGPVVVHPPMAGGQLGMALPDMRREIARYENWDEVAASGWKTA